MRYNNRGLKILKILTVVAPAVFIGLFELSRHTIFIERQPMILVHFLVFGVVTIGAFFLPRLIVGIIEGRQRESMR